MLVTINYLADLTGKDRRTIQKRLTDIPKSEDYTYPSKDALNAIYCPAALDAQQERAQLDRARRELAELAKAQKMGDLIPAEVVAQHWSYIFGNVRAKLLNLPGRVAIAMPVETQVDIEKAARAIVYEALQELADGANEPG